MFAFFLPYNDEKKSTTDLIARRASILMDALPPEDRAFYSLSNKYRRPDKSINVIETLKGYLAARKIGKEIVDSKPDVVYIFDTIPFAIPIVKAAKRRGIPTVVDIGDLPLLLWQVSKKRSYDKILYRSHNFFMNNVDHIVVRGKNLAEETAKFWDIKEKTAGVIYDPVEKVFFANADAKQTYRKKVCSAYNIPEDNTIIGYSGGSLRIFKNKRLEKSRGQELIEAVADMDENIRNKITVLITGDGPGKKYINKVAEESRVDVRMLGFLEFSDFVDIVYAHDISYLEGFNTPGYKAMIGSKLQQYMAVGNYIIAPNNGERTLWKECLHVIEPLEGDYSNYAAYIESIKNGIMVLTDKVRKGAGPNIAARQIAENTFSDTAMQQAFTKIADDFIGNK